MRRPVIEESVYSHLLKSNCPVTSQPDWGNVSLSPSVPSTGAGIATLNPIPEVPAGDIDLIAPLGTIDAGEAGIRVSGNINIAALRVVNAANIQTQGKSSGVPVSATVNTGAMSSASAAGAAASQAAEDAARSQQAAAKQGRPSIVTVEVLGFGTEPVPREPEQKSSSYNPNSPVQVLGAGPLSEQARARLTDEERKQITVEITQAAGVAQQALGLRVAAIPVQPKAFVGL